MPSIVQPEKCRHTWQLTSDEGLSHWLSQSDLERCQAPLKNTVIALLTDRNASSGVGRSNSSPWSGVEEVHGGGKGGLEPPGGAGAAARDAEGSGGDARVCAASAQGVVRMEGPGQTGKTPLCHHPQLW